MIEYLARRSGNKFVRINNHEHTDLQEYLGSYVSAVDGSLHFQEGLLVESLRNGYWIVLDELNLAPTDVLEALNRLLDDNRELLIPETQEVIRPHPDFMLFATQNPAGLYGGRKHLSRAFRNRFLEMHFDDIPVDELTEILHQRTQIPESWSKRIVDVYKELSALRQANRLFEQKSFATLRDLFRWALRKADSVDELAVNGFMLLAERVRNADERAKVKEIIEGVMSRRGPRIRIDEEKLYSETASSEIALYKERCGSEDVVWTKSMRRLFILVVHALSNNEPVLLVGETGCGKTTVCQMLADALDKELHVLNAHQNTETGDIIGSQRPIRNRAETERLLQEHLSVAFEVEGSAADDLGMLLQRYDELNKSDLKFSEQLANTIQNYRTRINALFEWQDGSLVKAMKLGQIFLLDEISLADDSVLERLNSVLEPSRSLLLAEKGPVDSLVIANEGFQFLATMNPGGDYGKKELSPALRNRFTEIWVPSIQDTEDVLQIVQTKLRPDASQFSDSIVEFARWFNNTFNTSAASSISIRDTLAWVEFVNHMSALDPIFAIGQGAAMTFIDTLGANPAALLSLSPTDIETERQKCIVKLGELIGSDISAVFSVDLEMQTSPMCVSIGSFTVAKAGPAAADVAFSFDARTTRRNLMRLFRGLQLRKPILIEGSPGVGKTTLVTAMAKALGRHLIRINLSEQTDLMDLFGCDIPVEGASVGTFSWRDAPFLTAMKRGDWVLLDEMNLASQSVLEGLNACLDHRGEAYIAELDQTFRRHSDFRIFAAQNPHHQGGGRKGLPASFVNRFTVVYADVFRPDDLHQICKQVFPSTSEEVARPLIKFVDQLEAEVVHGRKFGTQGGPWEFNLRDILRWLQLSSSTDSLLPAGKPYDFCDIIFRQRFRTERDRAAVDALYSRVFNNPIEERTMYHNLAYEVYQVGLAILPRMPTTTQMQTRKANIPVSHLPILEGMMLCVQQTWPVILVGPPGSGKSCLIEHLAAICGNSLTTFPLNSDIDAMDLVGGFEQVDPSRDLVIFFRQLRRFASDFVLQSLVNTEPFDTQSSIVRKLLRLVWHRSTSITGGIELENIIKSLEEATVLGIPQASELLNDALLFSSKKYQIEQARFEWVDSLLVQALQHGDWLILDNANLCNSSVLDRLNSLLEPDGYLSINEHPTENGEARILKPHPNFRIFLTMDPRSGELSRAMRNRAIELFVPPSNVEKQSESDASFSLESAMYRFRNFQAQFKISDRLSTAIADVTADHLSFSDVPLVEQFLTQIKAGLLSADILASTSVCERSLSLISSIPGAWTTKAQQMMASLTQFGNEQVCNNFRAVEGNLLMFCACRQSIH
jgi:midasin